MKTLWPMMLAKRGPAQFTQHADVSGTVRYWTNHTAASSKQYGGDGGPAVSAHLNFPTAVVVDREGNLYIADTMNHRVRRVDAETGIMSTVAGTGQARFSGDGGPANQAALNEPAALVIDDEGRLYIADQKQSSCTDGRSQDWCDSDDCWKRDCDVRW